MPSLAEPAYPDDDGAVQPRLAEAIGAYAEDRGNLVVLLSALTQARVLVPVVAVLAGERAADGSDKQADMAAVLMTGRDGRKALLAFSGLPAMRTWDADARPVPVPFSQAAKAALDEGAEAIVLDVAGPVNFVVEAAELTRIARGEQLVEIPDGYAWAAAR